MSTDYKLVNIVDSQIEDITSEVVLPVITGPKSTSYHKFNAQSNTGTTQCTIQLNIPSVLSAVDRNVMVQSTIDLKIDISGGTTANFWAPDEVLFDYGNTNALQAFPLNSLLTSVQTEVNTASPSVSTREIMSALLKTYNYQDLAKYNSLTPSLIDTFYYDYRDGFGSNNNVLANYSNGTYMKEFIGRGAYVVKLYQTDGTTPINTLRIVANANGTSPFASFILRFTVTEPLLFMSPFISGSSNNCASLTGLNKLDLKLTFGDATRVMSNASYALLHDDVTTSKTISNVTYLGYRDPKAFMRTMIIPDTCARKIVTRNVVNYNNYRSEITQLSTPIQPGQTSTITFDSKQLQVCPSKMLIYVKKNASQMTTYDSNSFMVINSINVDFNGKQGLLNSADKVQLYEMTVRNGIQTNFFEFSGYGNTNDMNGNPVTVPTTGSVLCIDPAMDLCLDEQVTNMSRGQFQIRFDINVTNQSNEAITPSIYLICVEAGIFRTENGTCNTFTGLLDIATVMKTKTEDPVMDKQTYETEVVGGAIENINALSKHMRLNFHKASQIEHKLDNEVGEQASRGLDMASGMSASGMPPRRSKKIHGYINE